MTRRVVFIFTSVHSANFHQAALVRALCRRASKWQCFDVGHWFVGKVQSQDILEAAKAADALVLHSSVFGWLYNKLFDDGTFYLPGPLAPAEYPEFVSRLLELSSPRVWLADNLDLHGDYEALGLRVSDFQALASFYFPKRFTAKKDMDSSLSDPWMSRYGAPEVAYDKLMKIPVQIENPFCLDESEFRKRDLGKFWSFTVPGIGYSRRRIARSKQSGWQRATQVYLAARLVRRAAGINHRITGWRKPNQWSIDFGRSLHHGIIGRSCSAYTEGSGYDYPVRKFVEIPAQKTLMYCTPHPGFEDRGFCDGVTHISIRPEDVARHAARLDIEGKASRGIIERCYNLVRSLHHADIRADQLIGAIELFAAGRLKSAQFEGGEYTYRT